MTSARVLQIPRAVADLPLQALLEETEDLAKDWAISLIASLPLERAGEVPLARLAAQAPQLCASILRALARDPDLEQLSEGGESFALAGAAGDLAGANDLITAVSAVESLRTVLWERALHALERTSTQQVSELSSRLSHVCSLLTIAMLSRGRATAARHEHPVASSPRMHAPGELFEPERREQPIEIHDTRAEGPTAWVSSIGKSLQQHARDGLPFVVALIEVIGIERLRHAEDPAQLSGLTSEVAQALRGELRPADILTREAEGRYWLLASDTDAGAARALAERLIEVVRDTVSHRGAPLEVAIGLAVCPEDGREASELAAQADMKLFAARASGLSLAAPDDFIVGADPFA